MRILHTADWHLGRNLHRASLLHDQSHALAQICDIARRERPDCVIVAGDIYDRAIPPVDAVNLLNWTLQELAGRFGLPIILISGNHDSGLRLDFARDLLRLSGLHIFGVPNSTPGCVTLTDAHGPVQFWALPWIDPVEARHHFRQSDVQSHERALQLCIESIEPVRDPATRSVLIAHAFVGGASVCEQSERKLMVGDAGQVSAELFEGFDYVALGHMHRPQQVTRETIRYAGSPLAYSFDAAEGDKCVKLVDLGPDGNCGVEAIPIMPCRPVRILSGTFEELIKPVSNAGLEDYLCIELTDGAARLDPHRRLQDIYPNLLHLRFIPQAAGMAVGNVDATRQQRDQNELELFLDFHRELLGSEMDEAARAVLVEQLLQFTAAEQETTGR